MRRALIVLAVGGFAASTVSCHSKASACAGVTGTCKGLDEGASESAVAAAFAQAQPGSTVAFGAGTFKFTNSLTLQQKNITIKGAGIDQTVLDFSGQVAGSDGILVLDNSDGIMMVDFTVRDTKGNATKVTGSNGVTYRRVKITWTNPSGLTHGAYGLYPVKCQNVLIESCVVQGASDAGIYVGQSQNIIVRNNMVTQNVAGIEIENSFSADVTGNTTTDNTAGILVFDLPNLPQKGGHNIRVFANTITSNNRTNFAAAGDIVGMVPAGMGFFVMANHDVEVFGNTITGNGTGATAAVSFLVTQQDFSGDPTYYPFPSKVYIHDNTVTGNGASPDANTLLGTLLGSAKASFTGGVIPGQLYDGIVDPQVTGPAGNPMTICFKNNNTGFADLHFDQFDMTHPLSTVKTEDATAFTCTLPALPAVTISEPPPTPEPGE